MASELLVTEQFQFLGIEVTKEVLAKCVSLCEEFDVDPETFTEQWMAFSLTNLNGATPTIQNLDLMARKEFSKRAASRPNAPAEDAARTSTGSGLKVYGASASTQPENDVLSNYMSGTPKAVNGNVLLLDLMIFVGEFASGACCLLTMTRSILVCSHQLNLLLQQHPAVRTLLDMASLQNLYRDRFITFIISSEKPKIEADASPAHNELCPATYSPTVNHSAKYAARTNQGTVVHSYGDEKLLEHISTPNGPNDIINISIKQIPNDDGDIYSKAMFGFELLHEKASTFDSHIRYISQCIMKKSEITEASSVRHKTQTEVAVAGRVECDADARLNPKSLVLQGSWEDSLSQAVPVDLDNVKQYSLFPGQVVVLRGVNPRGDRFVAREVLCDAARLLPDHAADMMNTLRGTMLMVVAAGPYTTSDNLAYDPLKDLVAYITAHKPHVVILTGPFLDHEHSKVKDNSMAETYKSFFDKLVDSLGELSATCPFTKIFIVSSTRDSFHVNIYPTPAYSTRRKHSNISFIPDPSTLNISGFIVGVTSADVLMHVSQEEISLGCGGDKLARLAGHILSQQSYYPLWPPPATLAVDAALWAAHAQLPTTPHVLVLPSNFRYFVKEVNGCVVVNPEHLTKGAGGGTFARLLLSNDDQNQRTIATQIVRI